MIPVDTANPAKVIQPALVSLGDGNIHALCRSDQGFVMESVSTDDGLSWSAFAKTSLPNPNAGIDAIALKNGHLLMVYNPLPPGSEWWEGRSRLSVAVSEGDGTWEEACRLEDHREGEYSYPSVIQAVDGTIHIVYTGNRKTIRHVVLETK